MFDSGFTERLLEKIGGNSATIVLQNNGQCVFVSSNSAAVLGIEREDLIKKNFLATVQLFTMDGDPVDELRNPIAKSLNDKSFVQSTPFFCKLSSDETDGTLAMSSMHISDSKGEDFVVVQIRKAKREVQVGEMKTLFVSFAAHQLKTPSSVVKGFLELMMRQGEAAYSKEQWHFLTSAFESNEQLIEVSKSLLNMARLEGGLIEPNIREFDPNRALQSKIASYAPLYKTKRVSVNLSISSDDNTLAVCNDESFFLEVFGILLGNAIKHSPIGAGINVSCVLSPTQCEIHVVDEGAGIPDAVKAKLFSEGHGASEKENSHGLGLYMAKKYIALLGGSIGIEDSEKGSDFYFTIPNVGANGKA